MLVSDSDMTREAIVIGTRGSALALVQANLVLGGLRARGIAARLEVITTEGDRRAPDTAWGEGAFVGAIEAALLAGDIDVAVHSAKDVPTDEDPRLAIAAYLPRAAPFDTIVAPVGRAVRSLADLPAGARVGTDSPRRSAFLRAVRPDLRLHPLHGNVDTRLRRLDSGETDALVLAEAGLVRLGHAHRISSRLDPGIVPPAPGQGAIAVQVRAGDDRVAPAVASLDDAPTRLAVAAERAVLAASGGGCRAPLGALGTLIDGRLELRAGFARPDGSIAQTVTRRGLPGDPDLVASVLDDLASRVALAAVASGAPRILVTRAATQSAALLLALVDRGLAPLPVPAIEIAPTAEDLGPVMARLDTYDWVVVTSQNAAEALRRLAERTGVALGGAIAESNPPRWAAVGVATERTLRAAGVAVAVRPARASGEDLAAALPIEPGSRVLLPRSDLADRGLVDRLRARGALVDDVVAYRTREAPAGSIPLLGAAMEEGPQAVIFTSGSTVRGALALADRLGLRDRVLALPAICIGVPTATEATRHGFQVAAEVGGRGVAAIAEAAAQYLIGQEEP
jgi:hydroxymethylbilane synthase